MGERCFGIAGMQPDKPSSNFSTSAATVANATDTAASVGSAGVADSSVITDMLSMIFGEDLVAAMHVSCDTAASKSRLDLSGPHAWVSWLNVLTSYPS